MIQCFTDFTATLKQDFIDLRAARERMKAKDRTEAGVSDDTDIKVINSVARIFTTLGMVFGTLLTLSAFAFNPFGAVVAGTIGISTVLINRDWYIMSKNVTNGIPSLQEIEKIKDSESRSVSISKFLQEEVITGTLLRPVWSWGIRKVMTKTPPQGKDQRFADSL